MPLLETSFGKWQGGAAPAATSSCPAPAAAAEREIYIVDKPGAPQSQVRIGWVGVPRSTPDYFPITVMNTVLGGVVLVAAQPEPSREARLHLRRAVAVRHARRRRAVRRRPPASRRTRPPTRSRSSSTS